MFELTSLIRNIRLVHCMIAISSKSGLSDSKGGTVGPVTAVLDYHFDMIQETT